VIKLVDLADMLNNMKPPEASKSPIQRQSTRKYESRAPQVIPASKMRKGEQEYINRVAVIGSAGTGKTASIFLLVDHLGLEEHLNPEEIRIEVLDLDGGASELTNQKLIPDEYLDCINFRVCRDFEELVDGTRVAFEALDAHKLTHGGIGNWLVIDNVEKSWEYVQNDYCLAVYGMTLMERKKHVRESQVNAKKLGGKGEGLFDQKLDWGTIKPMYADWIHGLEVCGHNVLFLSPWKMQEVKDKSGNVVDSHEKFGADSNSLIVSYIIKLHMDDSRKRKASFVKSRATNILPKDLPYSTWTALFKEIDRVAAMELREREAQMSRKVYGRKVDGDATEEFRVLSDEDEAKVNTIMDSAVEQSKKSDVADFDW
jgi:hypothetical protein